MSDDTTNGPPDVFHHPRREVPPMGIMPRKYWIENRVQDILESIELYRRSKYIIPIEWVDELSDHLRTLRMDENQC